MRDPIEVQVEQFFREQRHEIGDSRLSRSERSFKTVVGESVPIFCISCGGPGGAVTKDFFAHVFYVCNGCFKTHGGLPLPEVPEPLLRRAT